MLMDLFANDNSITICLAVVKGIMAEWLNIGLLVESVSRDLQS